MQYVHEHTGVSNIANNAAYAAIVQIVNECTTEYKQYNKNAQARSDVAYVKRALAQFAKTKNVDELINTIAQQDTYVRDFYAYIVEDLHSDYYNGEWE